MTSSSPDIPSWHSIADVERDTGLSKDTLRVWERRYGFPMPARDALGERQYDNDQLIRLRHIRRLIDAGHRPGRVVALPLDGLVALNTQPQAERIQPAAGQADSPLLPVDPNDSGFVTEHWMALLRRQDAHGLRQALGQLAQARAPRPPRILLTTLPGEVHGLGLLMAECFMVLEGCHTISLGVQTPLPDIVTAVDASEADIVALSFTAAQNPRDVRAALGQLRERLPAHVQIWAGGNCPVLYKPQRGRAAGAGPAFLPMGLLQDIQDGVARWRALAPADAA